MLTIASVPKPFVGIHGVHQRNALASWHELPIEKQIVLLGGEQGVHEAAAEFDAICVDDIQRDEFGTPLLDAALATARAVSDAEVLCYVNADIILLPDTAHAIKRIPTAFDHYLFIARRWNLDFAAPLDVRVGWDDRLRARTVVEGELFLPEGIDLFVFSASLYGEIPAFSIGRSYWDMWLVFEARRRGAAVIDATEACTVIHQNHPYTGVASIEEIRRSPQGRRNFKLAGDSHFGLGTVADATHTLGVNGLRQSLYRSVSVVIPHRGPTHGLRGCLRFLAWQTYPHTFVEVVVVFNEQSAELDDIRTAFPYVKVLQELMPGPAAARNTGVRQSLGELIAFLDSDCTPSVDWLAESVRSLEREGPAGIVAGDIARTFSDRDRRSVVEAYDAVTFLQQERYVTARRGVTANLSVSRALWSRVGEFDESFTGGAGEDWDWTERAEAAGASIVFSSTARVQHPALPDRDALRRKVRRIEAGNIRRWRKGGSDAGPPTVRQLRKRLRRLVGESRLTRHERLGALYLEMRAWWWRRQEWASAVRRAQE